MHSMLFYGNNWSEMHRWWSFKVSQLRCVCVCFCSIASTKSTREKMWLLKQKKTLKVSRVSRNSFAIVLLGEWSTFFPFFSQFIFVAEEGIIQHTVAPLCYWNLFAYVNFIRRVILPSFLLDWLVNESMPRSFMPAFTSSKSLSLVWNASDTNSLSTALFVGSLAFMVLALLAWDLFASFICEIAKTTIKPFQSIFVQLYRCDFRK